MSNITVWQPKLDPIDREIAKLEQQLDAANKLLPYALQMAEVRVAEARGMSAAAVRSAHAAAHRQELVNEEYAQKIRHGAHAPDVSHLHQQLAAQQKQIEEANRKLAEATRKLDEAQARINRAFDNQGAKASKLDSLLRDDDL